MTARLADKITNGWFSRNADLHLKAGLSARQFLASLEERGARYVVLPPDEKADAGPDSGLDILISDDAIGLFEDMLSYWPSGPAVRIFSESGTGGFGLAMHTPHEMSLFPPYLASEVLAQRERSPAHSFRPSGRHRLLTRAYRDVYLARREGERAGFSEIMHEEGLESSSKTQGFALPSGQSRASLETWLSSEGWRPPQDTLDRIGVWSPWVNKHSSHTSPAEDLPPGLAVFFIRDRAVSNGFLDDIRNVLDGQGFEILTERVVEDADIDALSRRYRGGNWARGPYPMSGGGPRVLLFAIDVFPLKVPPDLQAAQPLLANRRLVEAKTAVRNFVFRSNKGPRFNAMHSTDNALQAFETLKAEWPEAWPEILADAHRAVEAVTATPAAIKILPGNRRRAQVELIELNGVPAVRKIFRRNKAGFLQRETHALRTLEDSPFLPKLLASDDRSITLEFIDDAWRGRPPAPLPLEHVRQLSSFMHSCCEKGLDPIDLMPGKNLMLREDRIAVLDLEFCHLRDDVQSPEDLYSLSGVPVDFPHALPIDTASIFAPYSRQWFPYTGMDLKEFLHGSPEKQAAAQRRNRPRILLRRKTLAFLGSSRLGQAALRQVKRRRAQGQMSA